MQSVFRLFWCRCEAVHELLNRCNASLIIMVMYNSAFSLWIKLILLKLYIKIMEKGMYELVREDENKLE